MINCHQLKMTVADDKRHLTCVADTEQLIQSVPSPEAEGDARKAVEAQTGVPVITSKNAAQLNQIVTHLIEGIIADADDETSEKE